MRFKKIYIEITNTCNLSCSFCIQNQRTPRAMSLDEFQTVITQIQPYTNYVYLHVLGEPLSHPLLQQMLSCCQQAGIFVNLTTNGTLLRQTQAQLLACPPRQINVSLHSFPAHKQPQYLQDVIGVCKKLAAARTFVSYRLWCMQEGKLSKESQAILAVLEAAYGVHVKPNEKGSLRLQDATFLHLEDEFMWPRLENEVVSAQGTCLGMKSMCGILSDGTVVPCCLDAQGIMGLGNIFQQPFSTIVESDRAKNMVDGFRHQQVREALCQHCSYRLRFTKK